MILDRNTCFKNRNPLFWSQISPLCLPWKSQLTIILYAVKTNRDSIHRASTKTISSYDDNQDLGLSQSWYCHCRRWNLETTLKQISSILLERAWKELAIENHDIKVFLLFRFHWRNIIIIDSLVITLIHL